MSTAVGAFLLLMCLGAAAVARKVPPPTPPDFRGTQQQPLVIKSIPNAEELQRDAEYRSDRAADLAARNRATAQERRDSLIAALIGIGTGLILLAQVVAFLIQARQMRESVREMKAATAVAERAAEMAKTSADAATDANRLNREALIADQRPWVAAHDYPELIFKREDDQWTLMLKMVVANTGKTPAHNVRLAGRLTMFTPMEDHGRAHLEYWRGPAQIPSGPPGEVCFPQYKLEILGVVQMPREFCELNELPVSFILSACISYAFPQGQSRHITTLLYRVVVIDRSARHAWGNLSNRALSGASFEPHRLLSGWVAD
jgi:hypothetical protein